jgi:hypothetical protein
VHPDDPRLRARLTAALASAIAIAFVVTVAAVASSPAPRPDEATTAPPSSTASPAPTTTSATSVPTDEPAIEPSPVPDAEGDVTASDGATEDAGTEEDAPADAPTPTPSVEPSPTPRAEEPPAAPRVQRTPTPDDHGAALWGRWFRAEHLRQGDETVVVAGDRPLHVGFLRQEGGDGLVWMTSCNTFGGDLAVGRERLTVRDIGGTATGCEEVQHDQEEWLADLFADGPHWRSLGERLRLWTSDGRRIDLVEDPEGPGPPWS